MSTLKVVRAFSIVIMSLAWLPLHPTASAAFDTDARCGTGDCLDGATRNPEHLDYDCKIRTIAEYSEDLDVGEPVCSYYCTQQLPYENGDTHGVPAIWCGPGENDPYWFCSCWNWEDQG